MFGEEFKGFNHRGHRGSQRKPATHKCRSGWHYTRSWAPLRISAAGSPLRLMLRFTPANRLKLSKNAENDLGQFRGPSSLTGTPQHCPNQIFSVAHGGLEVCDDGQGWL